jgi:release factor glutamine methyltransferase
VTAHASVDRAAQALVAAGFTDEDARRDAAVLARHVLGWSLGDWAARAREDAPPAFAARLDPFIARRARREPVAYLTGVREFYGREFLVTRDVLIPRPETELLVDVVLGRSAATVLDVGTGSGCLAITLALAWPDARVVATDTSAAALEVARANAETLGATRVEFVEASFVPTGLSP